LTATCDTTKAATTVVSAEFVIPYLEERDVDRSNADLSHTTAPTMNGLAGSVSPSGQLYVRALYDYDADDRTSLSFRQGDIIQVITQLESGWWDGVIHGVRGWFPSNYCAVVNTPYEDGRGSRAGLDSEAEESEEDYGEPQTMGMDQSFGRGAVNGILAHHDAVPTSMQEEAAFWIPQATPDGRLFYFNTLTGDSRMELPLEAPTSANETGPHDRTNIFIPDQSRPPAELMAAGYERDDDTDYASASEAEDLSFTRGSKGSSVSHYTCMSHKKKVWVHRLTRTGAEPPPSPLVPIRWRVTSDIHGFINRGIVETVTY
jgi:hypothetical protein